MRNRTARFTTSMGEFQVELFEDRSPRTTGNFVDLVEKEFYDGVTFHRVVARALVQTGDPTGTGKGGPGYTIRDEIDPGLRHRGEGVVSMANAGPDTGGSQFFITLDTLSSLDGEHAIFGQVIQGMDVVRRISQVRVNAFDRPLQRVTIEKIRIEAGPPG
jgi:cyclophilin family peptidyl-prolyl cis-trans isomerase